jgi:hypothetical protein
MRRLCCADSLRSVNRFFGGPSPPCGDVATGEAAEVAIWSRFPSAGSSEDPIEGGLEIGDEITTRLQSD